MDISSSRILVLGSQSFLDPSGKVGIQYIAEGLARHGLAVDYVSNSSSPLDILSKRRRSRFKRVWADGQDIKGVNISKNLTEYAFKAPYPTLKEVLRLKLQIKLYPMLASSRLMQTEYDFCIHDASMTALFIPAVKAKNFIFRLNDLPSGFSFAIHSNVVEMFDRLLESDRYGEIWAVSAPLAEYAASLNAGNSVVVLPNGIDMTPCRAPFSERVPKSAVFVGNIFPWIDLELINNVAKLLADWVIDFYGPLNADWTVDAPNVRYRGVLERWKVAETLRRYCVGLIPFKDVSSRMHTVERPLKFYEYVISGLGVASTDVGSLKSGMGGWALYGRTPEEFAAAMASALDAASKRGYDEILGFYDEHSWSNILKTMLQRLEMIGRFEALSN